MDDWKPSRPRPRVWRRIRNSVRGSAAGIVWIGAIGGLCWLGGHLPPALQIPGIVDSARGSVSSPVDGRLVAMLVTLHQNVEPGQVIARLDDADVRLKLLQATHELERLRADMALERADIEHAARAAAAERGLEAGVEQRRLVSTVESAQLAALSTRAELEEARVRVVGAQIEADRLTTLDRQDMVSAPDLVKARTTRDALQKRISELEALQREQQARIAAAQQRLAEFAPGGIEALPAETALAPMRWRLKAQEAALERIALDAKNLVLEAPMRGRIATVAAQQGEWIAAGRAIVAIVDPTPRRIVAYLPEALRPRLSAATTMQVTRNDATVLGAAAVTSISPAAVRLPERLWRDPQREEWGYELIVAATGGEIPGERVMLSLQD